MQYLTFSDYTNMGGTLDEVEFNRVEAEAETKLNYHTNRRLVDDTAFPYEVKLAVFKLIQLIQQKESYSNPDSGLVASVSNDGVSVNYATQTAQEYINNFDGTIHKMLIETLWGIGNQEGQPLIYRGVR